MGSVKHIETSKAPSAIGPYSQAVVSENLVFISGQLPLDPNTNNFVPGGIAEHTRQCLKNIEAIANSAGTDLSKSVKLNIYLADMKNFEIVNQAYAEFFPENPPARLALEVSKLPKNAEIEIEAVISI